VRDRDRKLQQQTSSFEDSVKQIAELDVLRRSVNKRMEQLRNEQEKLTTNGQLTTTVKFNYCSKMSICL